MVSGQIVLVLLLQGTTTEYYRNYYYRATTGTTESTTGGNVPVSRPCTTPQAVRKEILIFAIAHNLIRALIRMAAHKHNVPIERISFSGSATQINQWLDLFRHCRSNSGTTGDTTGDSRIMAALVVFVLPCLAFQT